jgi:hypothetical protein
MACLMRGHQTGPLDVDYEEGITNNMADFSSRSWIKYHYPDDDAFLAEFNSRFPLPPPFTSWQLIQVPSDLVMLANSILLRKPLDLEMLRETITGNGGLISATNTTKIPGWPTTKPRTPTTEARAETSSYPLLSPSGKVDGMLAQSLAARQSKERFVKRLKSSQTTTSGTPVDPTTDPTTSTAPSSA